MITISRPLCCEIDKRCGKTFVTILSILQHKYLLLRPPSPAPTCPRAPPHRPPKPSQAEGPFYIASPTRADITSGRSGAPLSLALRVVDPVCRPLKGATVALWHSDATGVHSAFASRPDGGNIADKRECSFGSGCGSARVKRARQCCTTLV